MTTALVDYRGLCWGLGGFLSVLTVLMLIPLLLGIAGNQPDTHAFLLGMDITLSAALILLFVGRHRSRQELRLREAVLLVVLAWMLVCLFGALPLWFTPAYDGFTDAVFESVSGFTTTGATVIADVDGLSRPVHLWRAMSHWVGGMGIILLGLAVLPLLGQGGNILYRAEFSGSSSERLRPRVMETARSLWRIYVFLTVTEILCLVAVGMDTFEAICQAFSTLGTGGFSTRTASIAGFQSPLVEYIVIVFMLVAGISFVQHFRFWIARDPRSALEDYEVRSYLAIVGIAAAIIGASLVVEGDMPWETALRASLFQTVSILTTTGFATADYAQWSPVAQLILLLLMFIGGCTGSTAGGLKVARVVLLLQLVRREFRRFTEPLGVFRVRVGGTTVPDQAICGLVNLFLLAILLGLAASLALTASGIDLVTAVSAVIACQFNVGPGLGGVGPAADYGALPAISKWVLTFCMIAGRLEFYAFLVVFTAVFWRR